MRHGHNTLKLCHSSSPLSQHSLSKTLINPHSLSKTHLSLSPFSSSPHNNNNTHKFLAQFSPFPSNFNPSVISSFEKRRILLGLSKMIILGHFYTLNRFSHQFCPFSLVKIMSFFQNRQTAIAFFKFYFLDYSEETVRASCVAAHLLAQNGLRYFSQDLLSWVVSRIGVSRSDEVVEFMWRRHCSYESSFSVLDSLMRAFLSAEMVPEATYMVCRMRENGLTPGLSSVSILFELSLRIGDFGSVWKLFREMVCFGPRPSVTTFNVIILGFVRKGRLCISESLLHIMRKFNCEPDAYTYNIMINAYCVRGRTSDGLGLLKFMREMDCSPNVVTLNTIINALCKEGNVSEARKKFDEFEKMGFVPNSYMYNTLIDGYVKGMDIDKANDLYKEMLENNVSPDVVTLNILVNAHYKYFGIESGDEFLKKLLSPDLIPECWETDISISISVFCWTGQSDKAMDRLEDMLEKGENPSVFAFNSVIAAYSREGMEERAFEVYRLMEKFGYNPSSSTCRSFFLALSSKGWLHEARGLLNAIRENRYVNVVAFTVLLDVYFKAGYIMEAQSLWDEMEKSGFSPDVVAYSAYINGLSVAGHVTKAHSVLLKMVEKGLKPNTFAYNSLIGYFCDHNRVDKALALEKEMKNRGFVPDVITYNIIIKGFCKEKKMRSAIDIFNDMPKLELTPDIVTYNTLISGCCKVFSMPKAKDFEKKMSLNRCFPDITTYNILMQGFCQIHGISEVVRRLNHLVSMGIVPNTVTYNTLLNGICNTLLNSICNDMLRCAVILTGKLIKMAFVPNIVTANLLLSQLCKQRLFERALWWGDRMSDISFQFDEITDKILVEADKKLKDGEYTEKDYFIDFLMKITYDYFHTYMNSNLRRLNSNDNKKVIEFVGVPEDLKMIAVSLLSPSSMPSHYKMSRKIEQVGEEAKTFKARLDNYYLRSQRRTQEARERAELLERTSGESSHILRIFDDESQAMQSARNSSRSLEESYVTGVAILKQYGDQKERLKRAQRKALDVLNTVGLSNSV